MAWGVGRQFSDERMAAVRGMLNIEGPEDVAERLMSTLASSTAPLERLQGKKPLRVTIGQHPDSVPGGGFELGRYHRSRFGRPARIHLGMAEPEDMDSTFMHELGHHASRLAGTGRWFTARGRGREEARADDFAARHHPVTHSYEDSPNMTGRRFKAGYQATRTTRRGHFNEGVRWGS